MPGDKEVSGTVLDAGDHPTGVGGEVVGERDCTARTGADPIIEETQGRIGVMDGWIGG